MPHESLTAAELNRRMAEAIERLDVAQARAEVEPFIRDSGALTVWSKDFFRAVASRIVAV